MAHIYELELKEGQMSADQDPIREQLIEARRNQILDAAAKVFAEKGFHRTTTKEIAKVMGANPGQPFRPRVKVVFDEKGRPLDRPQAVDLTKLLSVQVLEPIPDEAIKKGAPPDS